MTQESDAQLAQKLLQEALGLNHINDPTILRIEIDKKLKSLNKAEMIALDMKLGTLKQELDAGEGFQHRKKKLFIITMLFFIGVSFILFLLLFRLNLSTFIQIILWPIAVISGILGLRTLFNLINKRY